MPYKDPEKQKEAVRKSYEKRKKLGRVKKRDTKHEYELAKQRPSFQTRKDKIKMWQQKKRELVFAQRKLVSVAEAASILGVSTKTLRNWDNDGKIVAERTTGGHRRYLLSDIEKLVPNGGTIKFKIAKSGLMVPENFDLISTYKELTEYSLAFANGDIGFLLLVGSPGSGKSRQIKHDLRGKAITWVDNHVSNMGLYCLAYEAHNRPIVLDDVNHFISDKLSCSLIKALTQTEENKAVSWENPNSKLLDIKEIPRSFTTKSPICLIGNGWNSKNNDYAAIQDRALPVAFFPDAETIHARVIELGWCKDQEIISFIGDNLATIPQPSMREYYNAMRYKRAKMDWRRKLFTIWEAEETQDEETKEK